MIFWDLFHSENCYSSKLDIYLVAMVEYHFKQDQVSILTKAPFLCRHLLQLLSTPASNANSIQMALCLSDQLFTLKLMDILTVHAKNDLLVSIIHTLSQRFVAVLKNNERPYKIKFELFENEIMLTFMQYAQNLFALTQENLIAILKNMFSLKNQHPGNYFTFCLKLIHP